MFIQAVCRCPTTEGNSADTYVGITKYGKYVGPLYCRGEMYAGRVA